MVFYRHHSVAAVLATVTVQVVVASTSDLSLLHFEGLSEGVYLAGTGTTGAGQALLCLGAGYFGIMLASALAYRLPWDGYTVAAVESKAGANDKSIDNPMITKENVHIDNILKTPQFWQMWLVFAGVTTAGMGLVSMAKTLMSNLFASQLPLVVTG